MTRQVTEAAPSGLTRQPHLCMRAKTPGSRACVAVRLQISGALDLKGVSAEPVASDGGVYQHPCKALLEKVLE